jgi:alpha-L-arabinofuranosidase
MYRPHMGGQLVPLHSNVPDLTVPVLEGSARLPGLSGSASRRDQTLTVTLTNPSLRDAVRTRLRVVGGTHLLEARATVLTHEDMRATNTFEKPEQVALASLPASVAGDTATIAIPKQSVVAVSLQIG